MCYLNLTPEKDKWYISEGFKASVREDAPFSTNEMRAHNQGRSKMILAGPFDTKEAATSHLCTLQHRHGPFVWLCE
jgi:hypothetical protein